MKQTQTKTIFTPSTAIIAAAVAFALYHIITLLLTSSTIISIDGYYHIAVTKFIKKYGFLDSFQWTQASIWKEMYSDKDLLLHLIILPFTYFSDKLAVLDKCGVIALNVFYFTVFGYVLKKYVPPVLAGIMLILCFVSPTYTTYLLYLRPAVLALTFTILGLYFLSGKNKYGVLIVTFLYTLGHISAFTMIFFALLGEYLRYELKKEFYYKNILYCLFGFILGLIIHPNFPANLVTIYVNGFLTPFYAFADQGLNFGKEMFSSETKAVFINDFVALIYLGVMFWLSWVYRPKLSHRSFFLAAAAQIYLVLGLLSNRFWFMVIPLMTIAMASYLKDVFFTKDFSYEKKPATLVIYAILAMYLFVAVPIRSGSVVRHIRRAESSNITNEETALWMKDNIPAGETIFHSSWSYSTFLICINPKNNYLVTLDPIYMYYWSPAVQKIYQNLAYGKEKNAYYHLKNTFKTKYGITHTKHGFYRLIKNDSRFKIIHRNKDHIIFKLL